MTIAMSKHRQQEFGIVNIGLDAAIQKSCVQTPLLECTKSYGVFGTLPTTRSVLNQITGELRIVIEVQDHCIASYRLLCPFIRDKHESR